MVVAAVKALTGKLLSIDGNATILLSAVKNNYFVWMGEIEAVQA